MDFHITIKNNTRKLAAAINFSNSIEDKIPPFLTKDVSEIYGGNLNNHNFKKKLIEFLIPKKAVTFSQQVSCLVKQSWQLLPPPNEIFVILVKTLKAEIFRSELDERKDVIDFLKTIFRRGHGNPFEIAYRLLAVEPVSEEEICTINDRRFDFEMRLKIVERLFSARNEMNPVHALQFIDFIGSLNDSYRADERSKILDLARKTSSLPYVEMLSLIIEKLSDDIKIHPQGWGALKLAFISFQDVAIDTIVRKKLWEHNLPLCENLISSSGWSYKEKVIEKHIELYNFGVPKELKILILENLKSLYNLSYDSCDYLIQDFVIEKKESEIDSECIEHFNIFDEEIDPNILISNFLADSGNYLLQKRLRRYPFYVVPPLLDIVKDKDKNSRDRNAALSALKKINHIRFQTNVTKEMLSLLIEADHKFSSTHNMMFDCIKADVPGLKEYLEEIHELSDASTRRKIISVWDRVYPYIPRIGEKND